MSSIRKSRTRLLTAAATGVLAALSLTACNDSSGVRDEGSSTNASATASPSSGSGSSSHDDAKPAPAGSKPAGKAPATKTPAASGNGKTGTGGKAVTCQGSNTKTVAAPLNRPVNHMLLTVTNTGSSTCYLYSYPAVHFGEAQSVPPVIEASQPQAVVTLKPGESGYASVNLSAADGSGSHGRTEKSLDVYFHGPSGNESVGTGAHPSLPAKGIYVDDSLKVTYWQQSMDDAVSW
ncbi:DUF4232 domain-containing protein [Streptomyces inhibens]|uniref:DUF4232 domain-containing protein n=1 Tax=Streptomyces inhibens TaxID=2293571 RepID=UPI001EE6C534|nr:DUF4232 domain-containing protein [Streptomyces inhibens]UKY51596.1 DUF4232 domain-containing protein [Streptomyces inhibens]